MLHPDTELRYIDADIGYGVFATRDIPKGTITWARDSFDLEFTPDEARHLDPLHADLVKKYAYRNHLGHFILCWDFGRYVNHSFESNCISTGYDFEIAVRDIRAGDELTDDYGYLNLTEPFKPRQSARGREYVFPDDLLHFHDQWDTQVQACLPLLFRVPQPLLSLVPQKDLDEIKKTLAGKRPMKSILAHYCKDPMAVLHPTGT